MPLPTERLAALIDYAAAQASPPDDVSAWLMAESRARFSDSMSMQSSWDQALLLGMLTTLARPAVAVEVGTFTGLVALQMARALPPGGRLVVCDTDPDFTALAREAWERGGVADRINLVLAPAVDTLADIDDPVDFAFVDADKGGYVDYLDLLVPKMPPHALLAFDNTLSGGRVLDGPDGEAPAIVAFNQAVAERTDCEQVLVPIRDGLTLVRRIR